MSRKGREYSQSGIYHILFRCALGEKFFRGEADYKKFSDMLFALREECGFSLYAYMLTEGEIRLLIKVSDVSLESITKRLSVKYAYWYNCKYQRNGSLFFDRFMSEPVEDDEKFDDVYRFIITRPQALGMCDDYKAYPYGSYKKSVDVYHKVSMKSKGKESLVVSKPQRKLTDEAAEEIILSVMGVSSLDELLTYTAEEKYKKVAELIEQGVGYRQLARLCNMNYVSIKKYQQEPIATEDSAKKPVPKKAEKKAPRKVEPKKSAAKKAAPKAEKIKKSAVKKSEPVKADVVDFFSL